MTIDELRTLTRAAAGRIEDMGPDGIEAAVEAVRSALASRGLLPGCHVGLDRELTPDEQIEWYAGQLLDIVDTKAWSSMNTFLNLANKFCPASPQGEAAKIDVKTPGTLVAIYFRRTRELVSEVSKPESYKHGPELRWAAWSFVPVQNGTVLRIRAELAQTVPLKDLEGWAKKNHNGGPWDFLCILSASGEVTESESARMSEAVDEDVPASIDGKLFRAIMQHQRSPSEATAREAVFAWFDVMALKRGVMQLAPTFPKEPGELEQFARGWVPVVTCQAERDKLTSERDEARSELVALRKEVSEAFELPPGIGPAPGEMARILKYLREASADAKAIPHFTAERDKAQESLKKKLAAVGDESEQGVCTRPFEEPFKSVWSVALTMLDGAEGASDSFRAQVLETGESFYRMSIAESALRDAFDAATERLDFSPMQVALCMTERSRVLLDSDLVFRAAVARHEEAKATLTRSVGLLQEAQRMREQKS